MSDERNVDTGGGGAVSGDVNSDSFTGRDRIEQKVNVYTAPSEPERQTRQRARKTGLMPEVEKELRQSVDRLNATMIRLEGTVEKNNAVTIQSIDAFKEQLTTLKAQLAAAAPTWLAYFIALCLLLIAVGITVVSVVLIAGRLS